MSDKATAICPECGLRCAQGETEGKFQAGSGPDDFTYEPIHWIDCASCEWEAYDFQGERYDIAFELGRKGEGNGLH